MSDIMTCMPFEQLLDWIQEEYKDKGTVFGVHTPYIAKENKLEIFDRKLETPIGPAAGPNSQLTQNIVAAYFAGSRFFELKTVQIMDGAELAACVNKPCIKADDEGYNCEWSTELYVPQAQDEYIKAWFLLTFMAMEYGLGKKDGFQFNLSVGYDLEGIKSDKINTFIENMKDASNTSVFKECMEVMKKRASTFEKMTAKDVEEISPYICNSATISTLHGCPPKEIESIANYLINEKNMHTFIKCNPTLLGYDFARETLDKMGYDYIAFGRFHFEDDLQYADAIPMLLRLMKLCKSKNLEFGVKITNTFPVDVLANELPSEEMYMSGRSLYPLSISLAARLSKDFGGELRISYSGGADAFNIEKIVDAGVWPVTVATTILKPGGYQRIKQIVENVEEITRSPFKGVDVEKLNKLATEAINDDHHRKSAKLPPKRKTNTKLPLLDCFTAPCEDACPINQEASTYLNLARDGKFDEAFRVILNRNALPFITGTICAHPCQTSCNRNFYETQVQIRDTKLTCAEKGFDKAKDYLKVTHKTDKKVAVVGGGPSGMAAAYYLARMGAKVTIFEKTKKLGGVVSHIIPDFRIDDEKIAQDTKLLHMLGVEILYNTEAPLVSLLKKEYDDVILAVGASLRNTMSLPGGKVVNALDFLEDFNKSGEKVDLGKNVVVIGGGNTAMDTARAAKRCLGVSNVYLVYRRTKRYMPADEEELLLALEDGVEFMEMLSPTEIKDGKLICCKMKAGELDESNRPSCVATNDFVTINADTVIAAIGEKVPTGFYEANGLAVDAGGIAEVCENLESSVSDVYVIGDGLHGPSVVVKGMAQAIKAAEAIVTGAITEDAGIDDDVAELYKRRGILTEAKSDNDGSRCLSCRTICENCVEVCPNRANVSIVVPELKSKQIIHVDYMCNECGNCASFCPYADSPYLDKFTLFANENDMAGSKNQGFTVLDREGFKAKVRVDGKEFMWEKNGDKVVKEELSKLMEAVIKDYSYILR